MKLLLLLLLLLTGTPALAQAPFIIPGVPVVGVTASSGTVAAGTATATLPAFVGRNTYICGFAITSAGSTAAAVVAPTVTGIVGGTMTFAYASVAGVTLSNAPLVVLFTPCMPSANVQQAIVVSLPSLGAGNTAATVNAWGFQ